MSKLLKIKSTRNFLNTLNKNKILSDKHYGLLTSTSTADVLWYIEWMKHLIIINISRGIMTSWGMTQTRQLWYFCETLCSYQVFFFFSVNKYMNVVVNHIFRGILDHYWCTRNIFPRFYLLSDIYYRSTKIHSRIINKYTCSR